VTGGPGSFVVPINDREKFKEAIRTKLLMEVAGRQPERSVVRVADKEPRVSCLIGEKIWQDRWGR
jgi:bifunctional DNA-binding transcriptional regulator/antitoxin component of YhaV-PrlF toxin-antitoxin module